MKISVYTIFIWKYRTRDYTKQQIRISLFLLEGGGAISALFSIISSKEILFCDIFYSPWTPAEIHHVWSACLSISNPISLPLHNLIIVLKWLKFEYLISKCHARSTNLK